MNKQRLRTLRNELIRHARQPRNLTFNLVSWCDSLSSYYGKDANTVVRAARAGRNYCGTTACAMGLATTIPAFKKLGLRFDGNMIYADVVFPGCSHGIASAMALFDIPIEDARELFLGCNYDREDWTNPLAVADKITALLHTA